MKWLIRLLIGAIFIYCLILLAIFIFQRDLLYFPRDHYNPPPDWMAEVKAEDGSLFWWAAPERDTAPVLMVFHGNGSSIDSLGYIFEACREQGYGVLSVGYPGYPGNEAARPTQSAILEASIAQYDKALDLGAKPDQIIFYGTSLGSGAAAQLAVERTPKILILDAPFKSTLSIAKTNMPVFPVGLLMKDTYRSDLALENVNMPLIWIHGTQDRDIPLSSGQALFDGYSGPKSAHILEKANHINTWFHGGREVVIEALSDFENQP